jgi:hypothetical protein
MAVRRASAGASAGALELLDVRTHKAHTGVKSVPDEDFFREALCYG